MDGPVLGRGGRPGVREPAGPRQRGHAQPVGVVEQADVHADAGVPGTGAQAGHPAPAGAAPGGHQQQQPERHRGVFQVHRRRRRVPAQPHGVRRGQQIRQRIKVVAPRRPGAHDVRGQRDRDRVRRRRRSLAATVAGRQRDDDGRRGNGDGGCDGGLAA